ncbi:MAG: hypothetical protein JJE52_16495 [Acidimicrobiia bacterium]|nr:hypothetical protein [Acidimicrobiia bacterium]
MFDNPVKVIVAIAVAYFIIKVGFAVLRGMAAPPPTPLPPGEMRKVKIMYRCEVCGTEVRITAAPDEEPPPPRHCLDDMELVAPID